MHTKHDRRPENAPPPKKEKTTTKSAREVLLIAYNRTKSGVEEQKYNRSLSPRKYIKKKLKQILSKTKYCAKI